MRTFKKIQYIMLIALVAIGTMFTLTSCNDDDNDLKGVALHSFGPSPVLRGNTIKIIGADLGKVNKVVFPDGVEVSDFVSHSNGTIEVVVPQEAIPGHIKIVYPGGEITSKSIITFEEPITVDEVSPLNVKAGDIITVKGDYVYNIATATFADGVVVEAVDFKSISRKELQIEVPKAAVSGKITFSDGAEVPNLIEYETPLNIQSASFTSMDKTNVDGGDVITITGTNLQLIEQVIYPGDIADESFAVNAEGTQITTTVPAETCSGVITLKQFSGNTIATTEFAFPTITVVSVTPTSKIKVGDNVTIKGTLLDRVREMQLPGGASLRPGEGFAVANNGEAIIFTVPDSMVDGKILIIQNDNISVETETLSMMKMGNVFWTGNFSLGNWANNLEVAKDKDPSIWEAFSSAIKGPGKLTINFQEDMNFTWWQIKPVYRSDWNTALGGLSNNIVEMTEGQNSYTLVISQADTDMLYDQGWAFQGCNLTIQSMEWESAEGPQTIWEGNLVLDGGWGNNAQIDAAQFAALKDGSKIYFYYTLDLSSSYWQIKPMDGSWTPLSYNYIVDPDWQCIGMAADSSEFAMEVTAADVAALQSSGMVISGCWLTVTKVAIK
ncbi:MAG: hypothetical protein ACI4BC_02755 [Muribaculaceae bacterium]